MKDFGRQTAQFFLLSFSLLASCSPFSQAVGFYSDSTQYGPALPNEACKFEDLGDIPWIVLDGRMVFEVTNHEGAVRNLALDVLASGGSVRRYDAVPYLDRRLVFLLRISPTAFEELRETIEQRLGAASDTNVYSQDVTNQVLGLRSRADDLRSLLMESEKAFGPAISMQRRNALVRAHLEAETELIEVNRKLVQICNRVQRSTWVIHLIES